MRLSKLRKYSSLKISNDKAQMSNVEIEQGFVNKYDLEERTSKFGEEIIVFAKNLPYNVVNQTLIRQLIRSATSIGANYMEADCTETTKDFKYKISLCKKEAKESVYWLRMLSKAIPEKVEKIEKFRIEAEELLKIFSKILITCNKKEKNK